MAPGPTAAGSLDAAMTGRTASMKSVALVIARHNDTVAAPVALLPVVSDTARNAPCSVVSSGAAQTVKRRRPTRKEATAFQIQCAPFHKCAITLSLIRGQPQIRAPLDLAAALARPFSKMMQSVQTATAIQVSLAAAHFHTTSKQRETPRARNVHAVCMVAAPAQIRRKRMLWAPIAHVSRPSLAAAQALKTSGTTKEARTALAAQLRVHQIVRASRRHLPNVQSATATTSSAPHP